MIRTAGAPPRAESFRGAALAATVVAGLAAYQWIALPWLPEVPGGGYVWNTAAAAVLLLGGRLAGLTWVELGVPETSWRRATAPGAVVAAVLALGCAALLAVPWSRHLLADPAVGRLSGGRLLLRAGVLIPVGTALWEELAFRGVLLAALSRAAPSRPALVISSVLFGLWHVRGATGGTPGSAGAAAGIAQPGAVLVVIATAAAGAGLGWLRLRSGGLPSPVLVHAALNSLGLLAAALAGPPNWGHTGSELDWVIPVWEATLAC